MKVSKYDIEIANEVLELLPAARAAFRNIERLIGRKDRSRTWLQSHCRYVAMIALGADMPSAPQWLKDEAKLPDFLDRALAACLWAIEADKRHSLGETIVPLYRWVQEED